MVKYFLNIALSSKGDERSKVVKYYDYCAENSVEEDETSNVLDSSIDEYLESHLNPLSLCKSSIFSSSNNNIFDDNISSCASRDNNNYKNVDQNDNVEEAITVSEKRKKNESPPIFKFQCVYPLSSGTRCKHMSKKFFKKILNEHVDRIWSDISTQVDNFNDYIVELHFNSYLRE